MIDCDPIALSKAYLLCVIFACLLVIAFTLLPHSAAMRRHKYFMKAVDAITSDIIKLKQRYTTEHGRRSGSKPQVLTPYTYMCRHLVQAQIIGT